MTRHGLLLSFLALGVCAGLGWVYHVHRNGADPVKNSPGAAGVDGQDIVLDDAQRDYLWQVEHHVLVLSKHWFKDFSVALRNADEKALAELLSADFQGGTLSKPREETLDTGYAQVIRHKDSGEPSLPLDRSGFVRQLLEYRKPFIKPPQVKLYPKTMGPRLREDLDSAWQGAGVLRMWGEVGAGMPGEVVLHFRFQVPRPAKDHRPRWLESLEITQVQTARAPRFLLRDVTLERNIDPARFHDNWTAPRRIPITGGVYLGDFNRDGIPDMLVVDIDKHVLYQGLPGGKFKDVTAEMGLPGIPPPDAAGAPIAAFVDLDGDGWEDLILGTSIYRNVAGKGFMEQTGTNLSLNPAATGVAVCDFDKDGLVDIYVTQPGKGKAASWLDGKSGERRGNQLWRNLGNFKFEDVTEKSGTSGGSRSVFSAVWLDINNDGWPDIYVPNEFGNGILLVNNKNGTFHEHALMKGPHDFGTMGITCGDINNDGHIDLYLGNMYSKTGSRIIGNVKPGTYPEEIMAKMRRFVAGSNLYLNKGSLAFDSVSQAWQMNDVGWAYGPALVDLDNDGFLDLFATSGFVSASRDEPDG
jgi:hypothetical protein